MAAVVVFAMLVCSVCVAVTVGFDRIKAKRDR